MASSLTLEKPTSTGNLDEDVGHLCEQVYKLLGYMQEPMFSGNLVSLTQTVKSTLNLVTCAGMFLEDYFKPKLNGEPRTHCLTNADSLPCRRSRQPYLQKTNLDEFGRQLLIMKSSLDIGKDVNERRLPYTRRATPTPTVSLFTGFSRFGGGSRFETTTQGRKVGTDGADRTP